MSKVFVSTSSNLDTPEGFNLYDDVEQIPTGTPIEVLLYHSSKGNAPNIINSLLKLVDYVNIFAYVPGRGTKAHEIELFFRGVGARIEENEIYITNPMFLEKLIDPRILRDKKSIELHKGTVDVINDFTSMVSSGEDLTPAYLEIVGKAAGDLVQTADKANAQLEEFSKATVSAYKGFADMTNTLSEAHRRTKIELGNIVTQAQELQNKANRFSSGGGAMFPQVPYNGKKPILQIKELGNVKYLTSFALGLREYFDVVEKKRARLLIIVPPGFIVEERMRGITESFFIGKKDENHKLIASSKILITNHPANSLLQKIAKFEDDILIVLDKTVQHSEPAYRVPPKYNYGNMTLYAIESQKYHETFIKRVSLKRCFTSGTDIPGILFTMDEIPKYGNGNTKLQYSYYLKKYSKIYRVLGEKVV